MSLRSALFTASVGVALLAVVRPAAADVTTYHGDSLRTGWFATETQLTTSNVRPSTFGMLSTVVLDGRVDAEPLVLLDQPIDGSGNHNVVYVATENDSLYAIDADSGAILWQRSFGTAVPDSWKNGDDNVYPIMGILGTPTIDRSLNALYVVADTFQSSSDTFTLHAVALNNGNDLVTPVPIGFTVPLQHGKTWTFNPKYQLQRAGLLESGGSIYVTFGSNGDIDPDISRGTIVRYDATTLAPQNAHITDRLSLSPSTVDYYLSSIWQSGYAPAADAKGNVYFSTGNSDWYQPSLSGGNRPESVVKLSGDLMHMLSAFTPQDYFQLDGYDADLGSGGLMLLPQQAGRFRNLAVAGGKDGRLFVMNQDHLGGYAPSGPDDVLQIVNQGGCWCGPAYFVGGDNKPRVVTGGGNGVGEWVVGRNQPLLPLEHSTGSGAVQGYPDNGGTLPVISSNGTVSGSAVIWFVQRPQSSDDYEPGTPVTLMAYDPANLSQPIFSVQAGTWRHAVNSNANIVPTVANGKVYVASNEQLQIFGLLAGRKAHKR